MREGLCCAPRCLTCARSLQSRLLARHIGKEQDEIERTITRPRYFNPYEAVDFGIIDRARARCQGAARTPMSSMQSAEGAKTFTHALARAGAILQLQHWPFIGPTAGFHGMAATLSSAMHVWLP